MHRIKQSTLILSPIATLGQEKRLAYSANYEHRSELVTGPWRRIVSSLSILKVSK